jgi:hypothetical protein
MRTFRVTRLTLATLSVAGASLCLEPNARAQNTYLDAPFQQGSMRYRPSGNKPPKSSSSGPSTSRGLFRRNSAYGYRVPQGSVAPQGSVVAAPAAQPSRYYYYYPTTPGTTPRYFYRPY